MENYEEENQFQPRLVCNKGNMILNEFILYDTNKNTQEKAYNLKFDFKNLDPSKVNINALLTTSIYQLIEKATPDLIEKIYILKLLNTNEADICILFKPIGKEVGLKQKYMIFRSTKRINILNNSIEFYNKDLSLIDDSTELINNYLKDINLNITNYERMIFKYGKTLINLYNLLPNEILKLNNIENFTSIINLDFSMDFIISINNDLPLYMENIVGLMFKKIFYNLKQFIDNLNT